MRNSRRPSNFFASNTETSAKSSIRSPRHRFAGPTNPAAAAGGLSTDAAGLLLNRSAGAMAGIDFLHPRKPVPKKDNRPMIFGGVAAGVVLLIGMVWYLFGSYLDGLDEQARLLDDQARKLKEEVDAGAPTIAAAGELNLWEGSPLPRRPETG